jgi:hypothetical protein
MRKGQTEDIQTSFEAVPDGFGSEQTETASKQQALQV